MLLVWPLRCSGCGQGHPWSSNPGHPQANNVYGYGIYCFDCAAKLTDSKAKVPADSIDLHRRVPVPAGLFLSWLLVSSCPMITVRAKHTLTTRPTAYYLRIADERNPKLLICESIVQPFVLSTSSVISNFQQAEEACLRQALDLEHGHNAFQVTGSKKLMSKMSKSVCPIDYQNFLFGDESFREERSGGPVINLKFLRLRNRTYWTNFQLVLLPCPS